MPFRREAATLSRIRSPIILGLIANALSGALGGAGGIFANILNAGGMVGSPGPGRMVPALAFANAPRMHAGGWVRIPTHPVARSGDMRSGVPGYSVTPI